MSKGRNDLRGWYKLRWQVLERDKYTCQYCGQSAPDVKLEVDHKVAIADGGSDDLDNLRTSCWACNRGKSGLRQSIIQRRERAKKWTQKLPPELAITRAKQMFNLLQLKPMTIDEIAKALNIEKQNARVIVSRMKIGGTVQLTHIRRAEYGLAAKGGEE